MSEREPEPLPLARTRIIRWTAEEVARVRAGAGLTADPLDPRIGSALAEAGWWRWANSAGEELAEAGRPCLPRDQGRTDDDGAEGFSWWKDQPEAVQRLCPVVDVCYGDMRVGLLTVVRTAEVSAPVEYEAPVGLAKQLGLRLDYICPVYVQMEEDGGAIVLLEGCLPYSELAKQAEDSEVGTFVPVEQDQLLGMAELWLRLNGEVAAGAKASSGVVRESPAKTWLKAHLRPVAQLALAAAVVLAVGVGMYEIGVLRRPAAPAPAPQASAAEWSLSARTLRGAQQTVPVLLSREPYVMSVRVATGRKAGWVYQVDASGAYFLGALRPGSDGTLDMEYKAELDERAGFEFFVAVLADAPWPALEAPTGHGPAGWLSPAEARQLQDLAAQQDKAAIEKLLRQAVQASAPGGTACDVRYYWFEHRAP